MIICFEKQINEKGLYCNTFNYKNKPMKKITLLFIIAFTMNSWSQEYKRMINKGTFSVQEIQAKAEEHFSIVGTGRGVGYKPYKRWEYSALRSMNENGMLESPEVFEEAIRNYQQEINLASKAAFQGTWEELGPKSWNSTSGWNPGVGRITSIASENGNSNHMIVGGPSGGVWKTTNGGVNWIVLTDNRPNLDVYSLEIDPSNAQKYYWGSRSGVIYVSSNGGVTWSTLADIGSGTVNKILVHPTLSNIMYCSAENGGIFKSIDTGVTWTRIHPSATHGFDVEFKPGDPNTVYASGNQFFKSIDGGATFNVPSTLPLWTQEYDSGQLDWGTASTNENNSVTPRTGNSMAILFIDSPSNPITKLVSPKLELAGSVNPTLNFYYTQVNWYGDIDELHVYYKTSAAGAWTLIPGASYTTEVTGWTNISLALPNVTDDYYIAFQSRNQYGRGTTLDDVSVTTNSGTVFQDGFEVTPNQFGSGVKMMGVSPANANYLYVIEESGGEFGSFHKSIDGGTTFTKLNHTGKNYFGYSSTAADDRGQAPRDMDIAVDPNNAETVHIAGINSWRSTDGGANFSISSQWTPNNASGMGIGYCHADIDILKFINDDLYVGSDGGVYVAENPNTVNASFYRDLTSGIGMRQFYRIGISQTNPVIITGGAQDNGSSTYDGNTGLWKDWLGADGMEGFVDKTLSTTIYGTSQNGSLYRSTNGGNSYSGLASPDGKDGNWVTPFEQDPTVINTIYSGYDQVYKSTNSGGTWTAISQVLGGNLNQLKIAPSNNQIMYASRGSNLYKTTNGGATNWTTVTGGISGNINSIAIHPTNPLKIAVATSGAGKVYLTNNGGTSWAPILYNLPGFSAQAVVWHGNADNGLYVGMNYGVFYIDDTFIASTDYWQPFSNNLPNVRIYELEVNTADNMLYAGTYGRGLWKSDLYNQALSINDEEFIDLSLYPNPADNFVNISWGKKDLATIKIFTITGKLVYYAKDQDLFNTHQIDTSSFATGVYLVKVNTVKGNVLKKIIVE